ncbi:ABC transporter permease [Clostridium boliviensis]|uniref:ABC transporter permease n=1 Tax=Clostridium boliviensis TaxID=318465 RepID=A0ABU4GMZ0_9CLOT|nr:ABC transporter permease [Clostridium boliviensis]MDW2798966.1 ABC transporter permease [Clostridium boliviensis]
MKGFWNLVGFEYKKILLKRSVQVTLLLSVLITALSVLATLLGDYYVDGKPYESNYEGMVKDRTYARKLSKRPLDTELIMETVNAYAEIPESDVYQSTQEFQTIARPYSQIYGTIRSVFNTASKRFNMEDFQVLTEAQADGYYSTRHEKMSEHILQTHMSENAKKRVIEMDEQIKTPLTFSYVDGYTRFFVMINSLGLFSAFAIAICVAPLFSGEYTSGADQLILSAKYGKNRLIVAKIFTGFSLSAIWGLIQITLAFCLSLAVFGSDGGNAPLQLYAILSPYSLTMSQTAILLMVVSLCAYLMTSAITMLLSAKLGSPFGVIILVSVLLIAPMLGSVSEKNILLYNLYHLFPTQMTSLTSVVDVIQYEIGSLVLPPYMALSLFGIAVSILLTPLAYRTFKKHQIA